MSSRFNWSSMLVIFLLLFMVVVGTSSVKANVDNVFSEHVSTLKLLKVLPDKDWKPEAVVTHKEYVEFGEKLVNGRGNTPVFTSLAGSLKTPDGQTTYQEAISIAGVLMGYEPEQGFGLVKAMTPKLIRKESDKITGFDMAYIFTSLLYAERAGVKQTLLEERYVLGTTELTTSKVLQITANKVVLEDEGAFPLAQDLLAFTYNNENKLVPMSFSGIAVGMSNLKFLITETGELKTAILVKKVHPENIRVLLSHEISSIGTSMSYDFAEVKVKSDKLYKIIAREKGDTNIIYVAEAGETVSMVNENGQIRVSAGRWNQLVKERVYVESFYPHDVPLQLLSTKRIGKNPTYEGHLEVIPAEKAGHLYVINELAIELYLKKVVPSEIPINWGKEAFKVQAVAARSYAISQIAGDRHEAQSANVDDSTSSQMYNNCNENKLVNEAIKETAGLVPMYQGQVIDAVFSSTSSGYTAANEEVWNHPTTKEFPGTPTPYLRAKSQIINDQEVRNMTDEATALAFFKDWSLKSYDAISPFYRWKLELTREELENTINKNLPDREKADSVLVADFIQSISGTTLKAEDTAFSIGTLQDLVVVKRGQGGNMMILDVVGSNGTYRIIKEYNIRFVIRPMSHMTMTRGDVIINRYDGSKLRNYSILPSAFTAFEIERNEKNEIVKVTFYGGGNGHGVGMSQWGMKGMVDEGLPYDTILKHYYSGIDLVKIY